RLLDAEQCLRADPGHEDEGLTRGTILLLRALMVGIAGYISRAVPLAVEAQDALPASATAEQALASVLAGYGFEVSGDVTAASEHAAAAAAEQIKAAADLPFGPLVGHALLTRVHVLQGRLQRARALFADAEQLLGPHFVIATPGYCFGLGDLMRELG